MTDSRVIRIPPDTDLADHAARTILTSRADQPAASWELARTFVDRADWPAVDTRLTEYARQIRDGALTPGTVTMPAKVAMFLVAGHLNHLHAAGQDMGCCPVCCGPCLALKHLLDADQLDDIVRKYAKGGWDCWDEHAGQVDRAWLARAWRMTDCHDTTEATR